jgi:hypothetical protein
MQAPGSKRRRRTSAGGCGAQSGSAPPAAAVASVCIRASGREEEEREKASEAQRFACQHASFSLCLNFKVIEKEMVEMKCDSSGLASLLQ